MHMYFYRYHSTNIIFKFISNYVLFKAYYMYIDIELFLTKGVLKLNFLVE